MRQLHGLHFLRSAAALLAATLILIQAGCGGGGGGGITTSATTAKTTPATSKTTSVAATNQNTGGLTSIEAAKLAWTKAEQVFGDAVLWRLAPVADRDATAMKLDGNWQQNDRASDWFVWYADPVGENWLLISISGKSIADYDIGTRGSVISMPDTWPRQSTKISMKDAAAAAVKQGANMDALTWVEFNCDYRASDFRNKPMWVFACSETLANGGTLNYRIFVDALTGSVAGAINERGDKLTLPIDREALQETRAASHQDDLMAFFNYIATGDYAAAARQMAYEAAPNDTMRQMWLENFQSLKSLKVVSVEQAYVENWTGEWECFKVTLDVTTSAPPDKYGWENGRNTRWVSLIPQGAGYWKITELSANP